MFKAIIGHKGVPLPTFEELQTTKNHFQTVENFIFRSASSLIPPIVSQPLQNQHQQQFPL